MFAEALLAIGHERHRDVVVAQDKTKRRSIMACCYVLFCSEARVCSSMHSTDELSGVNMPLGLSRKFL